MNDDLNSETTTNNNGVNENNNDVDEINGDFINELYKNYVEATEHLSNYVSSLNIFQTCYGYANKLNPVINNIGNITMDLTNNLTNNISCLMNDNDDNINDMRDIAERVKNNKDRDIMRHVEVKIELGYEKNITRILIKKYGNRDYIQVPFEHQNNPIYIQNIIDTWFNPDNNSSNNIIAKPCLYMALFKRYENSRRSRKLEWYSTHVEWLKFKCVNDTMIPVGYKVFKNIDTELSNESSEF
jgi:hypothetical protein